MTLHEHLETKRRQNIVELNASGVCHLCGSISGRRSYERFVCNDDVVPDDENIEGFPAAPTTADIIDAFEVKYKCSDEEEQDVLKYYTQFEGNLNKMLECVMLSSDADKKDGSRITYNLQLRGGMSMIIRPTLQKQWGVLQQRRERQKGVAKRRRPRWRKVVTAVVAKVRRP